MNFHTRCMLGYEFICQYAFFSFVKFWIKDCTWNLNICNPSWFDICPTLIHSQAITMYYVYRMSPSGTSDKTSKSIYWKIYSILHVVLLTNTNNCGSTYCLETLKSLKKKPKKKKKFGKRISLLNANPSTLCKFL